MLNKFDNATPKQIILAMAEAMRRRGDGCTRDHLKLDGFSEAQLDAHGDAAREHAMALSERKTRSAIQARRAA